MWKGGFVFGATRQENLNLALARLKSTMIPAEQVYYKSVLGDFIWSIDFSPNEISQHTLGKSNKKSRQLIKVKGREFLSVLV
jgi:hypothetical protein